MEHVGIFGDDLAAATAFFVELGLKLQGEGPVEGGWLDRVVGLEGIRAEIAILETPDGHGRLELYWLCYVRGPEGIIVELAEQIG
jgi:catechol 2,3-dioxygenase-like lactoylglutathione lyase family enzyme